MKHCVFGFLRGFFVFANTIGTGLSDSYRFHIRALIWLPAFCETRPYGRECRSQTGHAIADIGIEPVTKDPFDRLLLGVCAAEGMKLVTLDRALSNHPLAWQAKT